MNVGRTREVLAVGATVVVGERTLENGAEHGGGDARPVEILAALHQKRRAEGLVQHGDLDRFAEKAAVYIGHPREALLPRPATAALSIRGVQPRVLAEHEEHEPRHQHGQSVMALWRLALAAQELDGGQVLGQVREGEHELRLAAERVALRVVHPQLCEVARHDIGWANKLDPLVHWGELGVEEACVEAARGEQLVVRARLQDVAVAHDHDLVSILDGGEPVCHHEARPAPHEPVEGMLDVQLRAGVDV